MSQTTRTRPQGPGIEPLDAGRLSLRGALGYNLKGSLYMGDNLGEKQSPLDSADDRPMMGPSRLEETIVLLCVDGELVLTLDMKEVALKARQIAVFVDGSIVSGVRFTAPTRGIMMAMPPQSVSRHMDVTSASELVRWCMMHPGPVIMDLAQGEVDVFVQLFSSVKQILQQEREGDLQDDVIRGFTTILLSRLVRGVREWASSDGKVDMGREHIIVRNFTNEMHRSAHRERSVGYYAAMQNLTPKYFSRVVTRATGKHPATLIQEYVVLEAKCLLRTGIYSIKEVCNRLNFSNQSFFSKYFKKIAGVSPGQYIKDPDVQVS